MGMYGNFKAVTSEELNKFLACSSTEEISALLFVDGKLDTSGDYLDIRVAEQLNRRWMGCHLNIEYNCWATRRLENVRRMTKEEWIAFDRKNAEGRESI